MSSGINPNGYNGFNPMQIYELQEIILATMMGAQMTDIEYNSENQIISYKINGKKFTKTYRTDGQVATISGLGRTWTYQYDTQDRLTGVV